MTGTYDGWLVGLSVAIAIVASYVALALVSRISGSGGRADRRLWLIGSACSMGTGIWSMHFVGMLAFRLPVPLTYDVPITLLSMLIVILTSGLALLVIRLDPPNNRSLEMAGVLIGIGIESMHYTGLLAMRIRPPIRLDPFQLALSILLAISATVATLRIVFHLHSKTALSTFWKRAVSALLMGAAMSGMHYAGMGAAIIAPHSVGIGTPPGVSNVWLAGFVGALSFLFLASTLALSALDAMRAESSADHAGRLRRANAALVERSVSLLASNAALERSEKLKSAMLESALDGVITADDEGVILDFNPAAERIFGYRREDVIGQRLVDTIVPKPFREAHERGLARYRSTRIGRVVGQRIEVAGMRADGSEFPVELAIAPVQVGDRLVFSAYLRDITKRKQADALTQGQKQVLEMIAAAAPLNEVLGSLMHVVEAQAPGMLCSVLLLDPGGRHLRHIAAPSLPEDYTQALDGLAIGPNAGSCGTAAYRKEGVVVEDIESDPLWADYREVASRHGLRAAWSTPIINPDGHVLGTFDAYCREPARPTSHHWMLIDLATQTAAVAISRHTAAAALRDSIHVLENTFEHMDQGISIADRDLRLVALNRRYRELLDLPGSLCVPGVAVETIFRYKAERGEYGPGDQEQQVRMRIERARRFEAHCFESERPNGSILEVRGTPIPGGGMVTTYTDITERARSERDLMRFRAAINLSSDLIYLVDETSLAIIDCNEGTVRALGYTRDELIGGGIEKIFADRTGEELRADFALVVPGDVSGANFEAIHRRKDGGRFSVEINHRVYQTGDGRILVGVARDLTERKKAQEQITWLAQYDALTGLPNRSLLRDRLTLALARARREEKLLGVIFFDLDRFKEINDSMGHGAGDQVLNGVSGRLKEYLREVDTMARLAGDEFVVLVEHAADKAQIGVVANKVRQAFAEPLVVDGREILLTLSIGISVYPQDGNDGDELLKRADLAMYAAKHEGGHAIEFYRDQMDAKSAHDLSLQYSLRRALAGNEFVLHYQPQAGIRSGKTVGVEALIRWNHPQMGLLAPLEFIGLAEDTGLIVPIGEWVTRTACSQSRAWLDAGFEPVTMSVNVSARQFRQKGYAESVAAILAEYRIEPPHLELEITESMLIRNAEDSILRMEQLRRLGVGLALDDFGTGYSSLSYLRRFPLTTLKVDQSFVHDLEDDSNAMAIAAAVIDLARKLGLKTVAEGVEHLEQLLLLESLNCQEYQGAYLSMPLRAEEVEPFLERRS